MKNKNKNMNIGLSILIVMFTAICLFTFVSIVLASAKQSGKHADIMVKRQQNYYDAASLAEQTIASNIMTDGEYEDSFAIDDDEILMVAYTITDQTYDITKWQIINIAEWNPDVHLNLIR